MISALRASRWATRFRSLAFNASRSRFAWYRLHVLCSPLLGENRRSAVIFDCHNSQITEVSQSAAYRFWGNPVLRTHEGTAGKAVPFFQFTNSDFGGDVKGHLRINRRFIRMLHSVAAVPFVDFIIEYHEGVKKSNSFMISVLIPPQGHQINCGSMRPEWHIIAVVGKKVGSTAINTRR